MKLKAVPGDFQVREVFDFEPSSGPYFVHVLRKEKLDTLEALTIVAREAGVSRGDIAFAGLKDRQAQTEQWISIRGKRLDWEGEGVQVRFVGRSAQPVSSKQSGGNRFRIVLRDLGLVDVDRIKNNVAAVQQSGFVNYFDDQRFGCIRHAQGFVAHAVFSGHYQRALRQMLAQPSRRAYGGDVKLKEILAKHWGDWETCAQIARGPIFREVFGALRRDPTDFRGALAALPQRLKLIHAFAFQSHLWNQAMSRMLEEMLPRRNRVGRPVGTGRLLPWRDLEAPARERFRRLETPLYGPRGGGGSEPFRVWMERELVHARLQPSDFERHALPGMVLKEEPRALVVVPRDFRASGVRDDDLTPGRYQVTLSFTLPRGAYATLLIKRLFPVPERERDLRWRERDDHDRGHGRHGDGDGDGGHRREGDRREGDRREPHGGHARTDERTGGGGIGGRRGGWSPSHGQRPPLRSGGGPGGERGPGRGERRPGYGGRQSTSYGGGAPARGAGSRWRDGGGPRQDSRESSERGRDPRGGGGDGWQGGGPGYRGPRGRPVPPRRPPRPPRQAPPPASEAPGGGEGTPEA